MRLILIEGIDGTGKTTACTLLRWEFLKHGFTCEVMREPGGVLRELALNDKLAAPTRLMLFLAARAELCNELKNCKTDFVILDRFSPSTLAYQGLTFDNEFLIQADRIARNGITPDYNFLMEMSIPNVTARIEKREQRQVGKQEKQLLTSVKKRYRQAMADLKWNYEIIYADNNFSTGKRMYSKLQKGGIIV